MLEIMANASPFQVFLISGLIALVPFLALFNPDDFNKKDR